MRDKYEHTQTKSSEGLVLSKWKSEWRVRLYSLLVACPVSPLVFLGNIARVVGPNIGTVLPYLGKAPTRDFPEK